MTVAYQEKFITLNGVRLRYLDWGTEGKTPLICMHGHAGQAHIWDEFAEAMSPHYHVYTLDQRGHGGSGWAVDGYARDRFVLDLAAFTEALGIQKCVLAGLSMGGWNALLYADAYPDKVDRAIIVDIGPERSQEALRVQVTRPPTPMAFYNFEEAFQWHREGNPWAEETRLRKDVANKMVQKSTGKWEWKADPALLNSTLADNQDPTYIDNYWRIHHNLPCPVLEVRGKESILLSDDIIERMKQASENFSSVDVEDAGHVVTVDKPQEFIEACLAFLGLAAEEEEAPPETSPTDLTPDDVRAMGKSVGLDISDADLAEVAHVLNAIIESIDEINPPWPRIRRTLAHSASCKGGLSMDLNNLPFLTVADLSEKIRSREVSPVDVVEAYLDRIEALNPVLNSYITVCADEARADAENAERRIAQGLYRGPMHGIPVAVKDQWWTKGVLTTAGSNILRDFVPDEDATVQTRLKEAGAILLGTTNLTEYAMAYTHHYPYGTPTNPWDQTRMPGGSSAGSGSATAAFMCATSLGEDTGGSIRGPAAYCGLAGLRPSQGRVSRYGLLGSCWSMDTIGPMSRTVRDCAITMQAIAGHDPKDAYTWKTPVPPYADLLDGDASGLRVGIVREKVYSDHVVPEMRDAVLQAGEILQDRGASVQEVSFPGVLNGRAISSPITYLEGATVHHARVRGPELHQYDHNMRITLLLGSLIPAQTYYKAQRLREMMRQDFLELMTTVDLLIFPTAADVAPPLTDKPGLGTKDDFKSEMFSPRRTLTSLANVVGAPALSVPCAFKDGLPLGLQIVGRPMEEDLVFRLGHAYQQDTDFHNRRPPI